MDVHAAELGAAVQRREHLAGVEKAAGVEGALEALLLVEVGLGEHRPHQVALLDADGLLNPGKVFPTLHRCAELGRLHIHGGKTRFPDLPRF